MDYTDDQMKILTLLPLDTIERECGRASINGMSSVIALRPRQEARGKRQKLTTIAFQVLSMSHTLMGSAIFSVRRIHRRDSTVDYFGISQNIGRLGPIFLLLNS